MGLLDFPYRSAAATVVVEGLARIGSSENGGRETHLLDIYNKLKLPSDLEEGQNSMLKDDGEAILPPQGAENRNPTKLDGGVEVTGLAYGADSIAPHLALLVLFLYMTMALGHTAYNVIICRSSETWDSFEDMMALSHISQPAPNTPRNTSAGIKRQKTLQKWSG